MMLLCRCSLLLWLVFSAHGAVSGSAVEVEPRHSTEIKAESSSNDKKTQTNSEPLVSVTTLEHGRRQIEWVQAKGGFVSDSFEIRQADPSDPDSRYGVFAASDIQASELLLVIPRDVIISDEGDEDLWICATVSNLAREMKLGMESQYEPYISYLMSQAHGQLPAAWSDEAKHLLIQVLGTDEDGYYLLPPDNAVNGGQGCGTTTELEQNAEMLVTQRSWDQLLIPVWDMVSHRNGHWTNAQERYSVHDESHNVTVEATRLIRKGEEIFMSYDHCRDCGGRVDTYGTPEIMRDYGFVEMFPQKFVFHEQEVAIGLDYPYGDDEDLVLHWYTEPPKEEELEFFVEQLQRVNELDLSRRPVGVSQHEYDVIMSYHHALTVALDRIISETTKPKAVDVGRRDDSLKAEQDAANAINTHQRPISEMQLVQRLVEFVRSKGGFVNSKLEIRYDIRRRDRKDANSRLGLFATSDIAPNDLLLFIPPECILSNPIDVPDGEFPCGTANLLEQEMRKGAQNSQFGPYIRFLNRLQEHGYPHLPSAFTQAGRNLLLKVLGPYGGFQHLPPEESVDWIDDWKTTCGGSEDELAIKAALVALQRHFEERLVPLMDMIGHRHGNWTNVEVQLKDAARVKASKVIRAGDEVFLSLGNDQATFTTPNMFRDRGWIEQYPQTWLFPRNEAVPVGRGPPVGFILESDLSLRWTTELPAETFYFEEQLERLESLSEKELVSRPDSVPENEWNLITEYHQAISIALKRLVEAANEVDACPGIENSDRERTCSIPSSRYNMLDKPYQLENYNFETCNPDISLDLSDYKILERLDSQYQNIAYFLEPNNRNVCFDLDHIYQICGSYRPHYHESVVHYAARFLPEIKRVLWVGGGDAMLLHEIIKYPSLELVIGLELDQKVTRGAFKYFGAQPNWDNEKVRWIYGDAAKSLLTLPSDLFGTFDLVLVDLSETVMSSSVTKGLDIMGALSLLLKPSGIFVKNEMYFEQLSNIFKHTLQVHFYSVPLVCSQCLILASNSIDFVNVDLHDHGVNDILFTQMQEPDKDLMLVRDYMHNPNAKTKCKAEAGEEDIEPTYQESSPGIALILDAEKATVDLRQTRQINATIAKALANEDLTFLSSQLLDVESTGSIIVTMLHEGYVISRSWIEQRYVAFDVHLWSNLEKLVQIKNSLLSAVGSMSPSAFRIVTTGMFGVPTWKEDQKARGPKFTLECDESASQQTESERPVDDSAIEIVLEESLSSFVADLNQVSVGVVCGPQSKPCKSLDVASNHPSVLRVVPLWACPEIAGIHEYDIGSNHQKFLCETQVLSALHNAAKIGLLVLDPSAPFAMAQILRAIAGRIKNKRQVFGEKLVVIATVQKASETWRTIFVDNFRLFYNEEPGFMSKVAFHQHKSNQSLQVSVFSAGDRFFITHMKKATANIAKRSGLSSDIRYIGGVKFTMQEDFEPEEFFLASDYDQRGPYEQWKSQQPVGHQTVFQFEAERGSLGVEVVRDLLATALLAMGIEDAPIQQFSDLGDGEVVTALWKGGNVVVLWDGRSHVSVNLFTYQESESFASGFSEAFTSRKNPSLMKVVLRDSMPRGYGRVVNFLQDVEPRRDPYWALGMDKWTS